METTNKPTDKAMIAGFPADFPHADKLVAAGILTPADVANAADEDLRKINGIGQASVIKIRAWLAANNIVATQSPAPAGQEVGIALGDVVPWMVRDLNFAIECFEQAYAVAVTGTAAQAEIAERIANYKRKAAYSLPPETPLTDEQLKFYAEIQAALQPATDGPAVDETVRLLSPEEAAEKAAAIERLPELETVDNAPEPASLLTPILPLLSHSMATGKLAEELVITIRNDDQIIIQTVRKDDGYREEVCKGATLEEVLSLAPDAIKKLKGWL